MLGDDPAYDDGDAATADDTADTAAGGSGNFTWCLNVTGELFGEKRCLKTGAGKGFRFAICPD